MSLLSQEPPDRNADSPCNVFPPEKWLFLSSVLGCCSEIKEDIPDLWLCCSSSEWACWESLLLVDLSSGMLQAIIINSRKEDVVSTHLIASIL